MSRSGALTKQGLSRKMRRNWLPLVDTKRNRYACRIKQGLETLPSSPQIAMAASNLPRNVPSCELFGADRIRACARGRFSLCHAGLCGVAAPGPVNSKAMPVPRLTQLPPESLHGTMKHSDSPGMPALRLERQFRNTGVQRKGICSCRAVTNKALA